MSKRFLLIALAFALACSMTGCNSVETMEEATDTFGVNVTVNEAVVRDVDVQTTYTGKIVTNDSAAVTSKVSAKIVSINAEIGDWVNKGQVLMVLDSTDYEYQLRQAEAAQQQAAAAYESAQTGLENVSGASEQTKIQLESALNSATIAYNNAKTNYDRQKTLYEMGAISLVAFESAESALENANLALESAKKNKELALNVLVPGNEKSAEKGVESAKAAMETARVAADMAREYIANTTITAPISGYVSAKNATIGQFASPGVALFTIADTSDLEAEINVTESVIPYVKLGGKAIIKIGSAGGDVVEGTVTVVNPVKDAMTGMYTVRVSLPDEEMLKIGMFCDVTLVTEQSAKNAVSVISTAVLEDADGYYVYVVSGNEAEMRRVEVGVSDGEYTQIKDGIIEGEIVVDEGKDYISEKNNIVNIVD